MKQLLLFTFLLLCFMGQSNFLSAQSKTKASIDFKYLPEKGEDQYNQRIAHKTIALSEDEFIILGRHSEKSYTLEKYSAGLKKVWQTEIPLNGSETAEAFFANNNAAIVITRRLEGDTQRLYGLYVDLKSGKKQEAALLLEAPAKGRRAGVAYSADGSKLLAYRYHTDQNQQIKDISSIFYDGKLSKLSDTKYNLADVYGILSADVKVSNTGEQYVCLISENMNRLTVRQYAVNKPKAAVMSVLVGGVYGGKKVYILDSKFELMPNNTLYGAVLTAEEATGFYHSLKAVKFDFEHEDMIFAEEFKFTPAYLSKVNTLYTSGEAKPKRFEDIYLSDLLLTPDNNLVVMAEKKYTAGGEGAPYFARDIHLFTYDEFMNTAWSSVLMKNQKAPAEDAFSGISYSAHLSGSTLNLLTLEELDGKYDLFMRQINTRNGETAPPKSIRLNLANDKELAYVKDFTAWLSDKDLITVVRPSRKATGLQLKYLQLK